MICNGFIRSENGNWYNVKDIDRIFVGVHRSTDGENRMEWCISIEMKSQHIVVKSGFVTRIDCQIYFDKMMSGNLNMDQFKD